jgi:hypothetical protein
MEGKDDLGASSPERPALHIPDPLSMTTGVPVSELIWTCERKYLKQLIICHANLLREYLFFKAEPMCLF